MYVMYVCIYNYIYIEIDTNDRKPKEDAPRHIPVVPARGRAEVALKIYIRPFSSIELACAVRQPSPCVRALCESGVLLHMSLVKLHFALHTSHCTLHPPHFISSELFSPYPSSSLLICHLSFHESLPSTTTTTCRC